MFTILSLNCASINAKIDQIKIKLQQLDNNGTNLNAVYMEETWSSDGSDTSLLQIDYYNLISQGKMFSSPGGLSIYLTKNVSYKLLNMRRPVHRNNNKIKY